MKRLAVLITLFVALSAEQIVEQLKSEYEGGHKWQIGYGSGMKNTKAPVDPIPTAPVPTPTRKPDITPIVSPVVPSVVTPVVPKVCENFVKTICNKEYVVRNVYWQQ